MSSTPTSTLEQDANIKNGVSRAIFAALAIILQLAFLIVTIVRFHRFAHWINIVTGILSILLVLGIYSQHRSATIRMTWIIVILAFPVFGVTMYLMIGLNGSTHAMRKRYDDIDRRLLPLLPDNESQQKELRQAVPAFSNIARYLKKYAGCPVWKNTAVTYYPDAAEGLEAQLADLKKAEKFIFMEYHAIEDKISFRKIVNVLREKVQEGVEVRIFYDDIGSLGFINMDFVKRMEALGIHCRVFNPVGPWVNLFLNNRDHRKITVIDGKVGFTGGYNLADEYFHITSPYGFWKDTGVRLEGPAVRSLTVIFLEMWNAVTKNDEDDADFSRYLPPSPGESASAAPSGVSADEKSAPVAPAASRSFVQPYADSPLDEEHVGENVYMSLAEGATDYVWFMTPYLIITDEMSHTLSLAAKRGVDVRIITPGIPDKKLIYQLTRSYYAQLVRNGVRIFEYTPGFCHAKMAVADDAAAVCGTINLDYRSLYHHFENGCILYGDPAVLEIKKDFESCFPVCREVTEQYSSGRSSILRIGQLILRLFGPLM